MGFTRKQFTTLLEAVRTPKLGGRIDLGTLPGVTNEVLDLIKDREQTEEDLDLLYADVLNLLEQDESFSDTSPLRLFSSFPTLTYLRVNSIQDSFAFCTIQGVGSVYIGARVSLYTTERLEIPGIVVEERTNSYVKVKALRMLDVPLLPVATVRKWWIKQQPEEVSLVSKEFLTKSQQEDVAAQLSVEYKLKTVKDVAYTSLGWSLYKRVENTQDTSDKVVLMGVVDFSGFNKPIVFSLPGYLWSSGYWIFRLKHRRSNGNVLSIGYCTWMLTNEEQKLTASALNGNYILLT